MMINEPNFTLRVAVLAEVIVWANRALVTISNNRISVATITCDSTMNLLTGSRIAVIVWVVEAARVGTLEGLNQVLNGFSEIRTQVKV